MKTHSQGSNPLKGAVESFQDRRRKRDSKSVETENAATLSSSLLAEKKMRQGDPGKAFGARVSRPGKPGATGSQRAVGGLNRLSRDPQAGVPNTKEKDSKKRIWSI